jgi:dihydrofolate synthase / folylpolyglutamate synthase
VNDPSAITDPRAYLASLETFGIKLGLSTIGALAAALGHPERQFRPIVIAGTNGKGSVAAMAAEALTAAGLRTGRYTSPHLVHLEERVVIDGQPVAPAALDDAILRVRAAAEELRATEVLDVHPTFFEATTAAAFELFQRAGVEVGVLEVGLGGRYDATNVVMPAATAITSIALDHERHLGYTLPAIAFEKAGIVKPGVPLVLGPLADEARDVVVAACQERGAPLVEAFGGCELRTRRQDGLSILDVTTPRDTYRGVRLALRGDHQVGNAVIAIRLLETLAGAGLTVPAAAIRRGLEEVRWPARLELVTDRLERQLLIDGAHNPAGAAALAQYIREEWPAGLPVVFGAMRDKDLAGMLRALSPIARPLIVTAAPGARAAAAGALARIAESAGLPTPVVAPALTDALARGWADGRLVVVAGSLFLAGAALAAIDRA